MTDPTKQFIEERKKALNLLVLRVDTEKGEWTFSDKIWEEIDKLFADLDSLWRERVKKIIPKKRNTETCRGGYKTLAKKGDTACCYEKGKDNGFNDCRDQILKNLEKLNEKTKDN